MTDTPHPLAALLRDVPRYSLIDSAYGPYMGRVTSGQYLDVSNVLDALSAALTLPDDEAGKVLEGVTGTAWAYRPDHYDDWGIVKDGDCVICQARHPDRLSSEVLSEWRTKGQDPWEANARFIAWCRTGVPALLAQRAADAARIRELEAEVAKLKREGSPADHALVDKYRRGGTGIFKFPTDVAAIVRKLDAVEARNAALEATVERMREALDKKKLAARLAPMYRADPVKTAALCDEVLDPSGALLGYLRDAAITEEPK